MSSSEEKDRDWCPRCKKIIPTPEEHDKYLYQPPSAYPEGYCWKSCIGEGSVCDA